MLNAELHSALNILYERFVIEVVKLSINNKKKSVRIGLKLKKITLFR